MLASFVITLREGLEAALVIAVLLSFLKRTGGGKDRRYIWYGASAALGLSVTAGALLYAVAESLAEEASEFFEVSVTLLAAVVLTFMIVWMRKNGRNLKTGLEQRASKASRSASPVAMVLLSFAAVGREGFETVLFLLSGFSSAGAAPVILGGGLGLALAAMAGLALYRGVYRLNLRKFFDVTGVILILLAAGLIGNAVNEIAGAGIFPAIITDPVWNTGAWLSHEGGAGAVLHSLLGYRDDPSPLMLIVYFVYLGTMAWIYFEPRLLSRD